MCNKIKGLTHPLSGGTLCRLESFIEIDKMMSTAVFIDHSEIDKMMSTAVFIDCKTEHKMRNATENWLFDPNSNNYERLFKRASMYTKFNCTKEDMQDHIQQYILDDLIEKDILAPKIEAGQKINHNAIFHMFIQYIQRKTMKNGQDPIMRAKGARTQAEILKVKAYKEGRRKEYAPSHDPKHMSDSGYEIVNVVYKYDTETGHTQGEPDYYVQNRTDDLEEQSENAHMKKLLLDRFGEDQVEMYYSLWLELRYEEYSSKRKWAESRQVTERILKKQVEKVKCVFSSNLEDFGYYA
jgi:hypothetical protein